MTHFRLLGRTYGDGLIWMHVKVISQALAGEWSLLRGDRRERCERWVTEQELLQAKNDDITIQAARLREPGELQDQYVYI